MNELRKQLSAAVESMKGKACWSVVAGEGTGSAIGFELGTKIKNPVPLRNPHLSEEQRNFHGELSLFVESSWRIETGERVICGAGDANDNDGPMVRGARLLIGKVVETVELVYPAADLTIAFRGGIKLRIFCDETDDEAGDNYSLQVGSDIYVVGPKGALSCEAAE